MLLFPVVDRLLGGSGGPTELSREVTEIEDLIAREFVRLIVRNCKPHGEPSMRFGFDRNTAIIGPNCKSYFPSMTPAWCSAFPSTCQSAGGDFQLMMLVASLGTFLGTSAVSTPDLSVKGAMSAKLAVSCFGN